MKDSDVTMEIPIHTTIAFAITELEIRHDGCFGENFKISVCFWQELFAPFDGLYRPQSCAWCQTLREGLKWTAPLRQKRWVSREQQITTSDKVKCCLVLSCPDVCSRGSDSHNVTHLLMYFSLLVELDVLSKHFNSLSALPINTRSSLLQQLTKVLEERGAVSTLQSVVRGAKRLHMCWWQQQSSSTWVQISANLNYGSFSPCQLDQVCLDERTSLRHTTASESHNFPSILELLERSAKADQLAPALTALYLTVSAMDGKKNLITVKWLFWPC